MRLSKPIPKALALIVLLGSQRFVTASTTGDHHHDGHQTSPSLHERILQQSCVSPGQRCLNQRGHGRPCCRGPDACPFDGWCPGGGRGSNNNNNNDDNDDSVGDDTASDQSSGDFYQFAVIGDTPYSEYEMCGIPYELSKMSTKARFLQHMGDLFDGQEGDCAASRYTRVANAFRDSPIPVHFVMGDNEFTQCPEGEAWALKQMADSGLLKNGDSTFGPGVTRGSSFGYGDEYYFFVDDNILFVGLSLPGNTPQAREQDSVAWTRLAIEQNSNVGAVVLFGHAAGDGYLSGLRSIAQKYGYLHFLLLNDSHRFAVEYPLKGQSNIKLIRVDDSITPMYVYVDATRSNTNNVFTYDRRCYCTTDHRPTKIVEWQGACRDACSDVHNACAAAETCSPGGMKLTGDLFTCNGDTDCREYGGSSYEPYCS